MTKEQKLSAAIVRTRQAIGYAEQIAAPLNSPEAQGVRELIDLATLLLDKHVPEFQADSVADDYDGLGSNARQILFPEDVDLGPDSYHGPLFNARSSMIGMADDVVQCAAALGLHPAKPSRPMPDRVMIERAGHEAQLETLLGHVRETREMVKHYVEPEVRAEDQGPLEARIIENYVQEMHVTNKSIHVTISVGDGIDLAVLERAITHLARATGEMIDTVRHWPGAAAIRLRKGVEAVRKPVRRAVGSIGGLILKLVRKEARLEPAPPPEDWLEQTHILILAGQAPPAHWVPHITHLNFDTGERRHLADLTPLKTLTALQSLTLSHTQVSDFAPLTTLTDLQSLDLWSTLVGDIAPLETLTALQSLNLRNTQVSDIAPLETLTALQSLDLGYTQVSDIAPLSGLGGLTIDVDSDERAAALRATLAAGSTVAVVMSAWRKPPPPAPG